MPTASAVVGDLIDVVDRPRGPDRRAPSTSGRPPPRRHGSTPPTAVRSRYYLRFTIADRPACSRAIAQVLGDHGISIASVIQHDPGDDAPADSPVPLVIMTHLAVESDDDRRARRDRPPGHRPRAERLPRRRGVAVDELGDPASVVTPGRRAHRSGDWRAVFVRLDDRHPRPVSTTPLCEAASTTRTAPTPSTGSRTRSAARSESWASSTDDGLAFAHELGGPGAKRITAVERPHGRRPRSVSDGRGPGGRAARRSRAAARAVQALRQARARARGSTRRPTRARSTCTSLAQA